MASVYARARKQLKQKVPSGSLIVSDKSLLFSSGDIPEPGTEASRPPPFRIAYTEIASVEVGHLGLNRWVEVRTNEGDTQFFAVVKYGTLGGVVDRTETQAAGDLLRSKLRR